MSDFTRLAASQFAALALDELQELRAEIKRLNKENSRLWKIIADLKKEKPDE